MTYSKCVHFLDVNDISIKVLKTLIYINQSCSMSFGFFRKIITGAVFHVLSLLTLRAKSLFVGGEYPFVLCMVGCSVVTLASTRWEPVVPLLPGMATKTVSNVDEYPWRGALLRTTGWHPNSNNCTKSTFQLLLTL